MLPTVEESRGYDFQDPENAEKWRGMFVNSLRKVLEQVHPTLTAEESALEYVESLCLRLLAMLCAVPSPLTVQDVEERVSRTFPTPLDKWAVADAREAVAARKRKGLMPYEKLHHMLQKEVLLYKIDVSVSIFITAILECVSADMLKLAGNFVKKISHKSGYETVTSRDIKTAMCADKVLMDMFYQDSELAMADASAGADKKKRGSLTYSELVRDLMTDERNFLRELNLIIRVFKEEIEKILDNDSRAISLIFGNIVDIYELTVTLLGNLEDACEMAQDSPTPYIGSCFEELAEVEEFRAYVRYANIVTRKESRDALQNIVDDPILSERLDTAGHGFRLAVKYYLPKLLLAPVGHVFLYHSYVLTLLQIAPAHDDRESFKQVECNLHPITKILQKALGNGPKMDATLRMATRARRQLAVEKCNELARLVDNWDNREIGQCCNEFIREDTLSKIGPGKRIAERRAYLFDGLLLLCKPINSIVGVNSSIGGGAGAGHQLKVKERLHVRKLDLLDRPDTDEFRNVVELCPRVGGAVVLSCGSCVEKRHWLADLVMLNTKPMLDRTLDSILLDLERRHPLRLPAARLYRFAVPDCPDNIVFEDRPRGTSPVPLIKGATLLKLIERLTYHVYADLALVRTFLTTYRSFCSPMELLDLLIERFNIPEPNEVYDVPKIDESIESVCGSDVEKLSKSTAREDWKRYRKEFQQPVKFRVINVLRHWVDQHFYDFERDDALHDKLRDFLETVEGKPMKKWVQSVLKTMQRKKQASSAESEGGVSHVFDRPAPAVLPPPPHPPRLAHHPLALHPIELARQLTLFEFHLYRMVRPSELVGAVWTKKDKEKTSPNLLRIIKHTTNFTRWIEKWIVESENLEERAAVVCRFLEVAVALRELNNFNGVVAVVAACGSAAVHRLRATFQMVPVRLVRALEELRGLNCDHFKRYQAQLRSINPPCVPFLGMYLTNILHIEEGNLDYLPNSELINLSKRRKVAEITGEIQQYQNQPYCLTVEPNIRAFLESLDPFPGMDDNEITNYLYSKSLEIEPRPPVKQMPKFPRQYPELSLKPLKVPRRALEEPQRYAHHAHHAQHAQHAHAHSPADNISMSQVSPPGWDGQSVASLPLHSEHRGSRSEERCAAAWPSAWPRGERAPHTHTHSSSQLSLLDKGLALFDKTKSTASLNIKSREEPSSPLERHSPRHERHPSTVSLPCGPSGGTIGPQGGTIGPQGERRALSPRSAIVDADVFYARPPEHLSRISLNTITDVGAERVPPLLPRGSMTASTSTLPTTALQASCNTGASSTGASAGSTSGVCTGDSAADSQHDEKPPLLPPRESLHNSSTSSEPPEPPDRPLPSPKHQELMRVGGMSPKRSPAPRPPVSPAVVPNPPSSANPLGTTDRWSSGGAFRFPAKGPPTPSPPPHLHHGPGTPPPLPPRRRKDSLPPPTPIHQGAPLSSESVTGSTLPSTSPVGVGVGVVGVVGVCEGVSPPPLPPRPPPAPQLLRPAHSTILQRRTRHTDHDSLAPRLPPKPPPALTPRP